ncbi:MAG: ribonuclease H family protein [Flavobacteriaceae bacterium]|nr:ribonuclease H family protein [Flavobacteriaceae bacterium]
MPKKKPKYYVVWKGVQPGIYNSWEECKLQITNFPTAEYKSFPNLELAKKAFAESYHDYKGKKFFSSELSAAQLKSIGAPELNSVAVDAACAGNPGIMEYRGVETATGNQIFKKGPYQKSTNNVGEFLALVHALALMKKTGDRRIIYSDSKIAIGWVKVGKCRTKLAKTAENADSFELIQRAELWLKNNRPLLNPILKWETKAWGEIPADFGRK